MKVEYGPISGAVVGVRVFRGWVGLSIARVNPVNAGIVVGWGCGGVEDLLRLAVYRVPVSSCG